MANGTIVHEPSEFPELKQYRAVERFFRNHLDMQFSDVRTLMKLPRPRQGFPAGCNFTAAAALANLIGGFAEVLYAAPPSIDHPHQSGARLKALLKEFYPWQPGERRSAKSKVLYYFVRNPLVHNLGIDDPRRPKKEMRRILIRKRPLTDRQLDILERANIPPVWAGFAVRRVDSRWNIYVPALYWGVFHLLRRLTEQPRHMRHAQAVLARYRLKVRIATNTASPWRAVSRLAHIDKSETGQAVST
jgi:hypothetical protein